MINPFRAARVVYDPIWNDVYIYPLDPFSFQLNLL